MNLAFHIARRYLFSKSHNAINIISMVSALTGVHYSNGLYFSVFNGFQICGRFIKT